MTLDYYFFFINVPTFLSISISFASCLNAVPYSRQASYSFGAVWIAFGLGK